MASRKRTAAIQRKTKETAIRGRLTLDGSGRGRVATGIPFLDHMLQLWAKHGVFDLELTATGDLHIDLHHTNEDLGLALGEAFKAALGPKRGIRRFGAYVPMDESLARVVVDISGRPHFRWDWSAGAAQQAFRRDKARVPYGVEDARHFLESFTTKSELTIHVDVLKAGGDVHHVLEAVFKALGRALGDAVTRDPRVKGVPSTKGRL
ncbi:MAG: imidazoleglycerol-phosphate dehydratase [Candidatus Omnitrophica bacterium]|nr:imidazoleglycerol-phosphate dehydratase [Candidatus Omnitrophota bacterium]